MSPVGGGCFCSAWCHVWYFLTMYTRIKERVLRKISPLLCAGLLLAAGCKAGKEDSGVPDARWEGSVPNPDGPQSNPDGPQTNPDGPQTNPDGPQTKPDGPQAKPDSGSQVPYSGSFPKGSGYLSASLKVAGLSRSVALYLPPKLGPKPPMLITLHGTGGDAKKMISSCNARELADKQQVVIASPQARKMTQGDWDNHYKNDVYWETHPNTKLATNPDLQLVAAMIHQAQQAYNVDSSRIYVLGHSNGGFFAVLSSMVLQDQIAAFVSNSAGLVRCAKTASCSFSGSGKSCQALSSQAGWCSCSGTEKPGPVATSGRKVPGQVVHANDDKVVSVYYSCALASRMKALGYTVSEDIQTGHGHGIPYYLAVTSWSFLSKHNLP